jgi:hypothetical protein
MADLAPSGLDLTRAATVVSAPFRIAVGVFTAVTIAVLYARLRGAREGVDVDEVGRVFD